MSAEEYVELKRLVADAPQPTPEEREEQRFDFAYGNLAASTNHKPVRAAFAKLAFDHGWSSEQFDKWAKNKEWAP